MQPNPYARDIAHLNFYEDEILFPDETPQDIIGFCVGLTGKPGDPPSKRLLNITCRRICITQEYTDIRREVGNLLLRLWDHKAPSMDDFWVNNPRKYLKHRDEERARRARESREVPIGAKRKVKSAKVKGDTLTTSISAAKFAKDHDGLLLQRVLERYSPALHELVAQESKPSKKKALKKTASKKSSPAIYVNGEKTHDAPLLDIVRPTLFIYTMDSNFVRFVDECVIPKAPSNRLDPYNRSLRLWFDGRVLGWYSKFDTEIHANGGEFWYDLKVQPAGIPPQFKSFNALSGSSFTLADPGDGMGGGERFP